MAAAPGPRAQATALARASGGNLVRAGETLLQLQRQHGNRHVQRVVEHAHQVTPRAPRAPVIQAKLVLGPPVDRYEREADRVARQVTHAATRPAAGVEGGRELPPPDLRRVHSAGVGVVDANLQQAIQGARGGGRPLPDDVRGAMETALGADFGEVRLHTDDRADQLARSLRARAFTTGQDIFFRRGQDGSSSSSREVLAHELTHVAQQAGSGGAGEGVIQRKLWQLTLDRLYDDVLNITATRSTGFPHIFVGDINGQDYEIGADGSGNPTLVPAATGFQITGAPSGWSIGGTQNFTPAPVWNPLPAAAYWESPGGKTIYSHSPGGTAYQQGPKKQGQFGRSKKASKRNAAGYVNPKQFSTAMLPLWEQAARPTPLPPNWATMTGAQQSAATFPPTWNTMTDAQKIAWYQNPAQQYEVTSGLAGQTMMITGYKQAHANKSAVVLGHSTAASQLFNVGGHGQPAGHTVPRGTNFSFNQTIVPFHGLEDYIWSAQSAKFDPKYLSPRPDLGSHPTYWDPTAQSYTGGPWHSYNRVPPLTMINYIDGKLAGVPAASRDGDHQMAMIELAILKSNFTQAHADQLLAMIKMKGW